MIVYRMERKGWGAFCGLESGLKTTYPEDALYSEYGCSIYEAKYDDNYRFACETPEALVEYFGSDFAKLISQGAEIVVYKVHKAHVRFGLNRIEVAFKVSKAERIN